MEQRWLSLARSYEFMERLSDPAKFVFVNAAALAPILLRFAA